VPDELALVDTDVASTLFREYDYDRRLPAALEDRLASRRLAISLITLGEAHYGARKRKWGPRRSARMLAFYRQRFDLIGLDEEDTAAGYGYLRASTEAAGRPTADNDLWIAACAAANGLPLVTLNRRHFERLTIFGVIVL